MEESLLPRERDEKKQGIAGPTPTQGVFIQEVKRLGYVAGPMVAVILTQNCLQVISIMMSGHLGELALSSTAMAISLSNVTGFSLMSSLFKSVRAFIEDESKSLNQQVLFFEAESFLIGHNMESIHVTTQLGMASALETLCGQAYGAKQYTKLGTQTYTAIFCLILVCIPISVIWIYMGKILHFIGQDPAISREAGRFTMWLVPALFAYATLQPLTRYFQTQSFIMPMLISSFATLCFPYTSLLGIAPISKELFYGIGEFFRFAIPSAVMICLEWWSFELLILLSGLLPNPELETSVLSVCLTTISTLYGIPYGLAAAASTRIANELGAGNPRAARFAVYAQRKEVVDYVTTMAPLVCLSIIMDSLQGVLSGVARGCGWQHIGAYINLGAFYLCGIPVAAFLGFWLNLKGMGLWIGIQIGAFTQTVLLSIVTSFTNWEKQARMARDRIFEGHDSGGLM
ncbi:hypothetical protein OIU76_013818 [Salix suchowensis]|nr:hypothetical protein OIU76_013818 [Salix suchowensis]